MAGAGKRTFIAGEVLTAAQVNDFLMDQAVMRFSGSAARAASITVPTEGMVTYLDDENRLEFYDGAAWQRVLPTDRISASIITAKGQIVAGSASNAATVVPAASVDGRVLLSASAEASGLRFAISPETDIIQAKGDLLVGASADSLTRLPVGTTGQILAASAGASAGVVWQTLPAAAETYTFSIDTRVGTVGANPIMTRTASVTLQPGTYAYSREIDSTYSVIRVGNQVLPDDLSGVFVLSASTTTVTFSHPIPRGEAGYALPLNIFGWPASVIGTDFADSAGTFYIRIDNNDGYGSFLASRDGGETWNWRKASGSSTFNTSASLHTYKQINNEWFIFNPVGVFAGGDVIKIAQDLDFIGTTNITVSNGSQLAIWDLVSDGNTRMLAVVRTSSGLGDIRISNDSGRTWGALSASPTSSTTWYSVDYGQGKFAVSGTSGRVSSTTDGVTWTNHTTGLSQPLETIKFGKDKWAVCGLNGNSSSREFAISTDLVTWTTYTDPLTFLTGGSTAYSPRLNYDEGTDTWAFTGVPGNPNVNSARRLYISRTASAAATWTTFANIYSQNNNGQGYRPGINKNGFTIGAVGSFPSNTTYQAYAQLPYYRRGLVLTKIDSTPTNAT